MIAVGDINQIAQQSFEGLSDDKLGLSRPFASPHQKLEYLSRLKQNLTTLTEQPDPVEFLNQLEGEPPSILKPIIEVLRSNHYSKNVSHPYNDELIKDSSGNKITTSLTDYAAYQAIVNTQIRAKIAFLKTEIELTKPFVDAEEKLKTEARNLVSIINRAYNEGLENYSRLELHKLGEAFTSLRTIFGDSPLTRDQSDQKSYIQNSLDFFITHKIDVVREHMRARSTDLRAQAERIAKSINNLLNNMELSREEYNDAVKGIKILGRADNDLDRDALIQVGNFEKTTVGTLRNTLNKKCREWVIKQLPKIADAVDRYLTGRACTVNELENIFILHTDATAVGAIIDYNDQFKIKSPDNFAAELKEKIEVQKTVELLVEAFNNSDQKYKEAKCYNDSGAIPRLEAALKQLRTPPLDATNKVYTAFIAAMKPPILPSQTPSQLVESYAKPIDNAINGLKTPDNKYFMRALTVYDRKANNWLRFNLSPTGELECFRFNGRNWQSSNVNFVNGKATWDVWDHSQEASYRIEYTSSDANDDDVTSSTLTRRSDIGGRVLTEKLIADTDHASAWVPLRLTLPNNHEFFSKAAPTSLDVTAAKTLGKSVVVNNLQDKTSGLFDKFNKKFGETATELLIQAIKSDEPIPLAELQEQLASVNPPALTAAESKERLMLYLRMYGLVRGLQLPEDAAGNTTWHESPPHLIPMEFPESPIAIQQPQWIRQVVVDELVTLIQTRKLATAAAHDLVIEIKTDPDADIPTIHKMASLLICGDDHSLASDLTQIFLAEAKAVPEAEASAKLKAIITQLGSDPKPSVLLKVLQEQYPDLKPGRAHAITAVVNDFKLELKPNDDTLKQLREIQKEWQNTLTGADIRSIQVRTIHGLVNHVLGDFNQLETATSPDTLEQKRNELKIKINKTLSENIVDDEDAKQFINRYNTLSEKRKISAVVITKAALIEALQGHLTTIYDLRKNKLTRAGADTNLNLMQHRAYMQDLTKNFSDHHGKILVFRDNQDRSAKILQLGDLIISQTQTQCSISVHHTPNPMDPKSQPREITEADLEAVFKPLFKTWAEHGVNVKRVWGNEDQKDFLRKLAWEQGLTVEGEAAPHPGPRT